VGKQGAEHLIETQCFGSVIEFHRQRLALPVQLKKYLGLVLENMRLDGLVDKIDSTGLTNCNAFFSLPLYRYRRIVPL
jgi:hypothetical protein